jgi:hypothetical protein
VWAIAQDHVNGNLLFAGTEFGLFFSVDAGRHWVQLRGGMPPAQVRDIDIQRRENDVVMATFGNGFWILDDYSPLREVSAEALNDEARLFPLRHAYQFQPWGVAQAGAAGLASLGGNFTTPNPPNGAVFAYHVRETLAENTTLVLTIRNAQGDRVREITLDKTAGLRRVEWDLRGDPPPPPPQQTEAQPGRGRAGAPPQGFGRGRGRAGGPPVDSGRYAAQLGMKVGDTVTAIGPVQTFQVKPLPPQNYILYR